MTQQEFLKYAIKRLSMTREEFANRIGTTERRINNWMLPSESKGYRSMDDMVWKYIREILSGLPSD